MNQLVMNLTLFLQEKTAQIVDNYSV